MLMPVALSRLLVRVIQYRHRRYAEGLASIHKNSAVTVRCGGVFASALTLGVRPLLPSVRRPLHANAR